MFSERLNLQQMTFPLDDQPAWLNDPRNTKYSEQRHYGPHDKKSCREYISKCSMFWGIQEVNSGEWIGTIAANIDPHNEIADLGILIHCEFSGNGYGREAWERITDFLFTTHRLRKVEAGCMSTNAPMRRVFESTGMVFECERKNHFLSDEGHPIGLVMYAKWPATR